MLQYITIIIVTINLILNIIILHQQNEWFDAVDESIEEYETGDSEKKIDSYPYPERDDNE